MKTYLIILFFFFSASRIFTQDVYKILKKSEDAIKGNTAHGNIEMDIVTPDYNRTLKMESWWIGNEKALIKVKAPRKEAGNKWLKIENEMWNYLKNTETTIKIPPSMMLQSWNGSDFTNDDLVRESSLYDDYFLKLIGEEKIKNEMCWKIQLDPKPDAAVVWGKLFYWVRKSDLLPARTEYYDEKNKLIRHMVFTDIKNVGNRKIPSKWEMINDIKEGHSTTFKIVDMKFDININDRTFSFQELERGN
ncbi:MAG: outer membrane lipoprotein-sorting protein [Ignavibacteria bacterium]|jgi:outer membrane lipoprotein-sorting protein